MRRTGDRAGLAGVLASSIVAMWDPTTLAERLSWSDEPMGSPSWEPGGRRQASFLRGGCRLEAGDVTALGGLTTAAVLSEELRDPFYMWLARSRQTMEATLAGPAERAMALSQETLRSASAGDSVPPPSSSRCSL